MTVTGERNTAWWEAEDVHGRIEGFAQVRREVERTIARLQRDVQEMNRRRGAWYRERWDIEAPTRLAIQGATRLMLRDVWQRLDEIRALLDMEIRKILAGNTVDDLKNNEAFSAFEDGVPLSIPSSSLNVFEHERSSLRRLLDRDTFDDLLRARHP